MFQLRSIVSLATCAAVAFAVAHRATAQEVGDSMRGRLLAERDCAVCHATGPSDHSPLAAAPPFRDLHRRYDVENLAEALAEGIVTGHPAMPSKPYPPDDVRDLIAYLRTLEPRDRPKR
jgi:cytochrome c